MANHKSAIKRIRSDYTKNQRNKYLHKTVRNSIKKLKTGEITVNAKELSKVFSSIDKLVKNNIIHKNKAAHLKSQLTKLNIEGDKKSHVEKKTKSSSKKTKAKKETVSAKETPVEEAPVEEAPVDDSEVKE